MSLRVEQRGPARILTLSRTAKKNALSSELCERLAREVELASADESVRGIVLAADGSVFAAGGDLDELEELLDVADGAERVLEMGRRLSVLETCPLPVVAAVTGNVYGGGCELLLLCDWVIVERGAELCFRHAAMGLSPAWGGASRLVERVGPLQAGRLLMTAAHVGAEEAVALGLAGEVAAEGTAVLAALAFVDHVARLDRHAVTAQKGSLLLARAAVLDGDAEESAQVFRRQWSSPAHREAMRRFRERARS